MNFGLNDHVAIVTGSSQGIGKAIAYGLSKEGAKVTICARNEERLILTSKEIESATKTRVLPIRVDLTNKGQIKSLIDQTIEHFGRLDILVNNTGGPPASSFLEASEEQWLNAVDSLLFSVVNCCREVIPYMKKQKWGRIINMTSFAAKQPADGLLLSNTIRAGVLGLTKTLSNELADYGILVNAVCPGWTFTKRVEQLAKSKAEKTDHKYEEIIAEWASVIPLKRLAQPREIANLVVFLASERSSYITGSVFQADGGYTKSLF